MRRTGKSKGAHGTQAPSIAAIMRTPALVFAALVVLLAANVALAYLSGGWLVLNVLVALASVALIGLFFMELRSGNPLNRASATAGFVWLVLFLMLTFGDYLTRVTMPF